MSHVSANPFSNLIRALSLDEILGGKVKIQQPKTGYRTAIDPVLLAAAITVKDGQKILDAGCGVGAAALCLLARARQHGVKLQVTGVDKESLFVSLALENAALNGFAGQSEFLTADIADKNCIAPESFDQILTNPPYLAKGSADASPDPLKSGATVESSADLKQWIDFCHHVLKKGGYLTMIHRADRMAEILALLRSDFGGVTIFPLWPKTGISAKRVIIQARKDVFSPDYLSPGLVLHEADGQYTEDAKEILTAAKDLILQGDK